MIERIDYSALSDDEVRALNAFENEMRIEEDPDDPPRPLEMTDAEARNVPEFLEFDEFWAREADGSIAAQAYGYWMATPENRHLLHAHVAVRPDRRGRGLGRTMLRRLCEISERTGRRTLTGTTLDEIEAGVAFARRLGAEAASAVHTNRLVLANADRDLVRRWIDEGPIRAPDYELVVIDGPYPATLIHEIAKLMDVMNTAPRDSLDWEDMHRTPEQLRQIEKSWAAQGLRRWSLFGRHRPSGRLVGFTEVAISSVLPQTVWQQDTGVDPEHRGHALGKWLKAAMLDRILRECPEAKDVRTGNADSNDAMLGINRALGFKAYKPRTMWQVDVGRVRTYVDGSSV